MNYNPSVFSKFDYNTTIDTGQNRVPQTKAKDKAKKPLIDISSLKEQKTKFINQLKEDIFVNSKKKDKTPYEKREYHKRLTKYAVLAFELAAVTALCTSGILKGKMRHDVKKMYSRLCDEMEREAQALGINFERPRLSIENLEKSCGTYGNSHNTIRLNKSMLSRKNFYSESPDTIYCETIWSNDFSNSIYLLFTHPKRGSKKLPRLISKKEQMALIESTLSHELGHAKQNQLVLNSENAIDEIADFIRKQRGGSVTKEMVINDLKTNRPFLFSYTPKASFSQDKAFKTSESMDCQITYTPSEMIEAIFGQKDTAANRFSYYTNLAEIDARAYEASVNKKTLIDFCKKHNITESQINELLSNSDSNYVNELASNLSKKDANNLRALNSIYQTGRHNLSEFIIAREKAGK